MTGSYRNVDLIRRMLLLAWRFRRATLKALLLQVLMLMLALSGLGLTGLGVDVIYKGFHPEARAPTWPLGFKPPESWSGFEMVSLVAGVILLIAAVRFILDRASQVVVGQLVQDIVVQLRADVYLKLERLSFRFFDTNETGSLINRVTGDVQAVRAFIDQVLIQVLIIGLSLTFFLIYMLSISPWLTLWCLLTTPMMVILTVWFSRMVRPAYRRSRELFDDAVRVLAENVQGVHVVKGFALESEERDKFAQANEAVLSQQRWIFWRVSIFSPLITLLPQVNLIVLVLLGGKMYIDGEIMLGTGLVVFAGLLSQFSNQVQAITQVANTMQRSLTGRSGCLRCWMRRWILRVPPSRWLCLGRRVRWFLTMSVLSIATALRRSKG